MEASNKWQHNQWQSVSYPGWVQGKKKKKRYAAAKRHGKRAPVKGDRYSNCPSCMGVGGNHGCWTCHGSGTVKRHKRRHQSRSSGGGIYPY